MVTLPYNKSIPYGDITIRYLLYHKIQYMFDVIDVILYRVSSYIYISTIYYTIQILMIYKKYTT